MFLSIGFSGAAFATANTYEVKSGDTLWKIAKKNHITIKQLKSWNQLSSDTIKPKQVLRITPKKSSKKEVEKTETYKELIVRATAYTANCKNCSGITATGLNLKKNPNLKVLSVDPKVIPLGSKVFVEGYGYAIAGDTGGSVKGNKIDVFVPSKKQAINWGVKKVKIKVYPKK